MRWRARAPGARSYGLAKARSGVSRIERDVAFAGLEDAEDARDERDSLFEEEHDRLGTAPAPRDQRVRDLVASVVELLVTEGFVVVLHGEAPRVEADLSREPSDERAFDVFAREPHEPFAHQRDDDHGPPLGQPKRPRSISNASAPQVDRRRVV
jgi:hypothetical protein